VAFGMSMLSLNRLFRKLRHRKKEDYY